MKSTVENLDPARLKLTVEVPYEELKPSLDAAYKSIGSQIQVPGFRRGHVPNQVIDQRVGRASVIQEAVNGKLNDFYREALNETGRVPMAQPEVEVTELPNLTGAQGGQLVFTAEVIVRPEIELPELDGLEITVDPVTVTDEDVETELENLRARFGSLKAVKRKAKTGDFVTIDLKAVIDGEEVDSASGVSYEIGKGNMLKGLDTALRGLKAEESATFTTTLAGGEHEGEEAEVTVTASAVKQRELPEADDDFAQMASEFDTIDELREDLRTQAAQRKAGDQAIAARDGLLDVLREKVVLDVPEALVDQEVSAHLKAEGKKDDDPHAAEIREDISTGVRDQIILDVLAEQIDANVSQDELIDFLVQTAQQYGMEPAQFMQGAQQAGQIPAFVSEIARNKSLALALRQVSVKDTDGADVDLTEFIGSDERDAQKIVSEVERLASPTDTDSAGSASSASAASSASSASAASAE
ncbi:MULTISPECIES: trigger factor [unclassified Actinomyces]|uniref:trigger factor n=1 Tax=unclassified Actinomyces TaxID=2609248 RepID=UPI002016BA67|nr:MULTISPECIES: trigger factor [unclassified Actinomyces]MCL3777995.1 trigger factor [Actinomyces sp. AC-20-1]MCL3789618.1 trigger factor [Actinomyces sp. 187325]MCL3791988.1 trigger factor [Actinomyces sp. 186855]MCL3794688.1 trigger factor [Actinomyces sp. 217892]